MPEWLAERVWWTKYESSLLKIYCLHSGFQSSLLFTHFRHVPNTCSHCSKVCHYTTPHFRDQRRAASLSRDRNRAEITVPMCEQKPYPEEFSCRRKRYLLECFHSRGQHLCKFIRTKESVCIRKEFNSHRTGLGHQHGRRFIVLGHQYGRRDVMWKHSIVWTQPNYIKLPLNSACCAWPAFQEGHSHLIPRITWWGNSEGVPQWKGIFPCFACCDWLIL